MALKLVHRGPARFFWVFIVVSLIVLCIYYTSLGNSSILRENSRNHKTDGSHIKHEGHVNASDQFHPRPPVYIDTYDDVDEEEQGNQEVVLQEDDSETAEVDWGMCYNLRETKTAITTANEYATFDFKPFWMTKKEFWDDNMENRFSNQLKDPVRLPLKVIIVPHSHNDPGWLKTFTSYFNADSKHILDHVIVKLTEEFKDMTFIWTEISFLQHWWDQAEPKLQNMLKDLVTSGRIEITTGGWVMTDEANVHIYAMLDQLIEGHQWVKDNLNVTPTSGWSIDPFGHGDTVPYLLSSSGFEGTIIQRIHYAWKQWFAAQQKGDFLWMPFWTVEDGDSRSKSLLTHNMPFDIYSIKHSCGPHPRTCLNFDFRKLKGEYIEATRVSQPITDANVHEKAKLLIEQYSRTASLFSHNVALIPVGDDFRYSREPELEQQYLSYKKLIDYINMNPEEFGVEIGFGTPKDYFKAIADRTEEFPTLKGDFFSYADIFSEGRPAYWSGYFTTRPSFKLLSRELEANLRSAEILFSVTLNTARQNDDKIAVDLFEKSYEKLVTARRNLGLFQHHDAITGTARAIVMIDYATRMFNSGQDIIKMQEQAIEYLLKNNAEDHIFVTSEFGRNNFTDISRKIPFTVSQDTPTTFAVYNSLGQDRFQVITIRTTAPEVKIIDHSGKSLQLQVNPVFNVTDDFLIVRSNEFEIIFVYKLPALSIVTFSIHYDSDYKSKMATLYCDACKNDEHSFFDIQAEGSEDFALENSKFKLILDRETGFLQRFVRKETDISIEAALSFAAYRSTPNHSGAYLFKPDTQDPFKILEACKNGRKSIITVGPIISEVNVRFGSFLTHTIQVLNTTTVLDDAIFIQNDIDYQGCKKSNETEMFMRFTTNIKNGDPPEFYTDMNGFQYQKRVKIPKIGVEGNYYPITQTLFMQDENVRLTLSTTHAQGAASLEIGQVEVMLERMTKYDDHRGLGEGIMDNRLTQHKFWLTFEDLSSLNVEGDGTNYQTPSLFSNSLANSLNYPSQTFLIEPWDQNKKLHLQAKISLLTTSLPCDLHLVNVRTLTDSLMIPSKSALLIFQRFGYNCKINEKFMQEICHGIELNDNLFDNVDLQMIISTSLTGLHERGSLQSFSSIKIPPMELRSFVATFK